MRFSLRTEKEDNKWQNAMVSACHSRGMQFSDLVIAEESKSQQIKALPQRHQFALQWNKVVHPGCTSIDVSQGWNRAPIGYNGRVKSLLTGSTPYDVEADRMYTGKDCCCSNYLPNVVDGIVSSQRHSGYHITDPMSCISPV